jgi:hypothetical protein
MEPDALLQRVRAGDELAWEAFVRQHQGRIFGLAYHYVGHAEDARDLAHLRFGLSMAWVERWWPVALVGLGIHLVWKAVKASGK